MALSRTEKMIAGAVVIGILVLVAQQGKDKEKAMEEGSEPDEGPDAEHRAIERQLQEIETDLDSLTRSFDVQWSAKDNKLPKSPPVRKVAEGLAERLQELRDKKERNSALLTISMQPALEDFEARANVVERDLQEILDIGSEAPVHNHFNLSHISYASKTNQYAYVPTVNIKNFDQRQHFDQRQLHMEQNIDDRSYQQDIRMLRFGGAEDANMADRQNFDDSYRAPALRDGGGPPPGGFRQLEDDPSRPFSQREDRAIARDQNSLGLNSNGPRAPRPDDDVLFRIKKQQGATTVQDLVYSTSVPEVLPLPPVAKDPPAPSGIEPGGNDNVVSYRDPPNFNPSNSPSAGDGSAAQDKLEAMNVRYRQLADAGKSASEEAVELDIQIDDLSRSVGLMVPYDALLAKIPGQKESFIRVGELYQTFSNIIGKSGKINKKNVTTAYTALSNHSAQGMDAWTFSKVERDMKLDADNSYSVEDIKARLDYQRYEKLVRVARDRKVVFEKKRDADDSLAAPGARASESVAKRQKRDAGKRAVSSSLAQARARSAADVVYIPPAVQDQIDKNRTR